MWRYLLKTMTREEIFAIWSPDAAPWARWAKPVLFVYLDAPYEQALEVTTPFEVSWAPLPESKVALVLDLPGAEGVHAGLALAARGYRPVPLYNAVPLPWGQPQVDAVTNRPVAAVDVLPTLSALRSGAELLASCRLPLNAPPAFLLDANRHAEGRRVEPDEFDNRSVCFTTDFPSANFLLAHGLQRALLVQRAALEPRSDLAHVLRRWQDGGVALERIRLDSTPAESHPFEVARPRWYGAMFQRALAALGLRRAHKGGFGAWMPESSATG
jgi:hypothetical protein